MLMVTRDKQEKRKKQESYTIIPDYSGENRLCRVNRNGRLIDKIGIIPTIDEKALENARPALAQAWRSFLDYNPNNGILIIFPIICSKQSHHRNKNTTWKREGTNKNYNFR